MASKVEHVFRQSDLGQFDFCLERGRALYFEEVEDKGNDSALYGSCVHSGIEAYLKTKRDREQLLSEADMLDVFVDTLDETLDTWDGKWVKFDRSGLIDMAWLAYHGWRKEVEPLVRPELIEWEFPPTVIHEDEERTISLKGTLDCVDKHGCIWDWKTSSRPYTPWEKQRWAVQPSVYTFGLVHNTDVSLPVEFNYGILLHDGSVQRVVVTRTEEHFSWLRHKLVTLAKVLESGQRPLPLNDTGWWCSPDWCANWDNCKGSHHGGDDWKKVQKV